MLKTSLLRALDEQILARTHTGLQWAPQDLVLQGGGGEPWSSWLISSLLSPLSRLSYHIQVVWFTVLTSTTSREDRVFWLLKCSRHWRSLGLVASPLLPLPPHLSLFLSFFLSPLGGLISGRATTGYKQSRISEFGLSLISQLWGKVQKVKTWSERKSTEAKQDLEYTRRGQAWNQRFTREHEGQKGFSIPLRQSGWIR